MNRPPDLPRVYAVVDLAQESDFNLGGLEICPSLRQVRADSHEQTVQPRVMQVLIALARANGAVVSRDALIESCWEGIVVGDDAINRCIVKLRQIAEIGGGGHFEVETIPRVGYAMVPDDSCDRSHGHRAGVTDLPVLPNLPALPAIPPAPQGGV